MATTLIIIVAVIGIMLCLRILVNYFLKQDEIETAEKIHKTSNILHEMASSFTSVGRDFIEKSQIAQPAKGKTVIMGAILEITKNNLPKFDPNNRLKNKQKSLIKESVLAIEKAQQYALKHNWQDGLVYLQECIDELVRLEGCIEKIDSIASASEIEKAVLQIKEDAEKISSTTDFIGHDQADDSSAIKPKKTYYEILDVDKTASSDEIKKSYKKLVPLYHPDKYAHLAPDMQKQAEDRFKEINEAHTVLSDPNKRKTYDQTI